MEKTPTQPKESPSFRSSKMIVTTSTGMKFGEETKARLNPVKSSLDFIKDLSV